jgi:hypothetical protein
MMFLHILRVQKRVASLGSNTNNHEAGFFFVGTFGGMSRVQKSFGSFTLACQSGRFALGCLSV